MLASSASSSSTKAFKCHDIKNDSMLIQSSSTFKISELKQLSLSQKQTHAWSFPIGLHVFSNQHDNKLIQDHKVSRLVAGLRVIVWSFRIRDFYLHEAWPAFHSFSFSITLFAFQNPHPTLSSTHHWIPHFFCSLDILYFNNSFLFRSFSSFHYSLFYMEGSIFITQSLKKWVSQTSWFSSLFHHTPT